MTNPVLCTCYIIQVHSRQRLIWKNIEKKRKQGCYQKYTISTTFQVQNQQRKTHHLRSTIYLIKFVVSIQVQIGNEASTCNVKIQNETTTPTIIITNPTHSNKPWNNKH